MHGVILCPMSQVWKNRNLWRNVEQRTLNSIGFCIQCSTLLHVNEHCTVATFMYDVFRIYIFWGGNRTLNPAADSPTRSFLLCRAMIMSGWLSILALPLVVYGASARNTWSEPWSVVWLAYLKLRRKLSNILLLFRNDQCSGRKKGPLFFWQGDSRSI